MEETFTDLLARPEPQELTDEELIKQAITVGLAFQPHPDVEEVYLPFEGGEEPLDDLLIDFARAVIAADRARFGRPAIEPVPVAERPWEREGWCDAEGRCWLHRPAEIPCRLANGTLYRWVLDTPYWDEEGPLHDTHSLPHHALPVPTAH